MGRGQKDAFTSVFGSRRGTRLDFLVANPNAESIHHIQKLQRQVEVGEMGEALEILRRHQRHLATSPLLADLAGSVSRRSVIEELQREERLYRDFFILTSVRFHWAEQLMSEGDEGRVIHIWPEGKEQGVRDWEDSVRDPAVTACGERISSGEARRFVPRGAWLGHKDYERCPKCAIFAPDYEECKEGADYPILGKDDLEVLLDEGQAALSARLPKALDDLGGAARLATRQATVDWLSSKLERDGDVGLARIFGYETGFDHLPDAEAWREILEPVKPTARNRNRYRAAATGTNITNSIHEDFQRDIKRKLWALNPEDLEPDATVSGRLQAMSS